MSIEIDKIIKSRDYKQVDVDYLEVLVDPDTRRGPVIGLKVDQHKGKSFIMPLDVDCARELCTTLMRTLIGLSELR